MSDTAHNSGIQINSELKSTASIRDITQNITYNTTGKPTCPSAPPPPEHFTGRAAEIAELSQRLERDPLVAITALQGMGGIGKTSLAKALCQQKYAQSGAVLWADVTASPNTRAILETWFSFAGTGEKLPVDAPLELIADQVRVQLTAALKTLSCGDRILVVLDDLWDHPDSREAVQILKRAAPIGAKTLITTRDAQIVRDLAGQMLPLAELSPDDAKTLVRRLIGDSTLITEDDIDQLIDLIGGHPLALEIASATVKSAQDRPHLQRILASYQAGLAGHKDSKLYDPKAARNLTVVFQYSYDHLTPDEQRAFRWLGVLAVDSVWERAFSAVLWDLNDDDRIDERITALYDRALIHRDPVFATHEAAWYGQHPLLRRYALGLLETNGERATALDRYTRMMTAFAERFDQLPPENWGQLTPYLPHVREVGDRLVQTYPDAPDEVVMRQALAFALNTHNYVIRRPEDQHGAWIELGLKAARGLGDRKRESLFLNQLGVIKSLLGEKRQALDYYEQSLTIDQELGDLQGEALTLSNIGMLYSDLGDQQRALTYFEQALLLMQTVGGRAILLNNIGGMYKNLGDHNQALTYFEQALTLHRTVGDRRGEAITLNNIGGVYKALGDHNQALTYYEKALLLQKAVGDRSGEASTLNNMAAIYFKNGNWTQAANLLRQIISIAQEIGLVAQEAAVRYNLAVTLTQLRDTSAAIHETEQAIALIKQRNLPQNAAGTTIAQMEHFLTRLRGD
ncbi:MAG: tetratricopeptide repeat protein [Anaerolineae bacterium]|nr:tetratricopeptide repeat protein [Anaerolineae bacterium]